jgi:hypothetical protein
MKHQKSCGPCLGKLVHQLPGVITFAYDLCFRHMIAHCKVIVEEINFCGSIMPSYIIEKINPKKHSFRPSKWTRKLKLLKIVNCQNCQKTVLSQLEKVGGHRYPPRSFHQQTHVFPTCYPILVFLHVLFLFLCLGTLIHI